MTGGPQTWCAYSLYLHPSCVQISAFHVQQIYSYKRINKFFRQKWQFVFKFRVPKSQSRDLGSSKLAYIMLLIISISSLFFQHAQKEAHNDICKSRTMRNHSLCILWMKRRSSAHQVSFTHTPTSYFNSKANGDKKSVSKNKPKKKQGTV